MIVAECCIALSFVQFLRDLSTAAAQPGNKGSGNKEKNHEDEEEEEKEECTVVCMYSTLYSKHNIYVTTQFMTTDLLQSQMSDFEAKS